MMIWIENDEWQLLMIMRWPVLCVMCMLSCPVLCGSEWGQALFTALSQSLLSYWLYYNVFELPGPLWHNKPLMYCLLYADKRWLVFMLLYAFRCTHTHTHACICRHIGMRENAFTDVSAQLDQKKSSTLLVLLVCNFLNLLPSPSPPSPSSYCFCPSPYRFTS